MTNKQTNKINLINKIYQNFISQLQSLKNKRRAIIESEMKKVEQQKLDKIRKEINN